VYAGKGWDSNHKGLLQIQALISWTMHLVQTGHLIIVVIIDSSKMFLHIPLYPSWLPQFYPYLFFLEHAGELRIIVFIGEEKV